MSVRWVRYAVGNENNPGDPFGRSELVIEPDGTARLVHHFSRVRTVGAWTGRVDPAALDGFQVALERAGFPATPTSQFVAGATLRSLTVEVDGTSQQAIGDWHGSSKLPGYAEAFDVLDGIIRQLSGDTVRYPTKQPPIVNDIRAIPDVSS
jgi:hypothetical protein